MAYRPFRNDTDPAPLATTRVLTLSPIRVADRQLIKKHCFLNQSGVELPMVSRNLRAGSYERGAVSEKSSIYWPL
jgi:hypothetical protein